MSQLKELKKLRQWVLADETKRPLNPRTKKPASSTNPSNWGPFSEVEGEPRKGFVLTKDDPFIIIDIDSKNPTLVDYHQEIVSRFKDKTYIEKSISGKGHHIILKGKFPGYNNALGAKSSFGIEIFYACQYVLLTENTINDLPPIEIDIEDFLTEIGAKADNVVGNKIQAFKKLSEDSQYSDDEIVELIPESTRVLLEGNPEGYDDASSARLALIAYLAKYTPDNEQILRMVLPAFRKFSGHFNKDWDDKIKHRKGGEIGFVSQEIGAFRLKQGRLIITGEELDVQPLESSSGSIEVPDGLLGSLYEYATNISIRPIPTISMSAALAHMSGLCGREFLLETDSPINLYCVLIARSGQGKSTTRKLTGKLLSLVESYIEMEALTNSNLEMDTPDILRELYLGGGNLASGPAVYKHLVKNPGCLFTLGEIGYLIKQMTANPHSMGVMRALLDAYQSSEGEEIAGYRYSDEEKSTGSIKRPAPSLLGDTTPGIMLESLSLDMVASGLLARFIFFHAEEPFVELHIPNSTPPKNLVAPFTNLAMKVVKNRREDLIEKVSLSKDAWRLFRNQDTKWVERSNTPSNQEDTLDDIYNRYNQHALKVAALLAIGKKAEKMPKHSSDWKVMIQEQDLEWAYTVVKKSTTYIKSCFLKGEVGEDDFAKVSAVRNVLRKYLTTELSQSESKYVILKDKNLIPRSYIQARVHRLKCFTQDPRGIDSLNRVLQSMAHTGELHPVKVKGFTGHIYQVLKVEQ